MDEIWQGPPRPRHASPRPEAAEALLAEDPGVRGGQLRAEVLGAINFTAQQHRHLLR